MKALGSFLFVSLTVFKLQCLIVFKLLMKTRSQAIENWLRYKRDSCYTEFKSVFVIINTIVMITFFSQSKECILNTILNVRYKIKV